MEKWEELTIKHNFIFGRTMETNPEICRCLLEKILSIKIKRIEYLEREKAVESRQDSRGIRLDIYVEDPEGDRVFDIEMQMSAKDNLAKRVRYYQGLMDLDRLKRGEHFSKLGKSYIIFICPFDLFKKGSVKYTFNMLCREYSDVELKNDATAIFLNTKGTEGVIDEDVRNFLKYIETGSVAGVLVKRIDDAVQEIKESRRERKSFMAYQMEVLGRRIETA